VNGFRSLGGMLGVGGGADAAVEARVRIGWSRFKQLMPLLNNTDVSLTRNSFYGTRYLSHCSKRIAFNPLFVTVSRDVIGHVTIGTTVGRFLLVIR